MVAELKKLKNLTDGIGKKIKRAFVDHFVEWLLVA